MPKDIFALATEPFWGPHLLHKPRESACASESAHKKAGGGGGGVRETEREGGREREREREREEGEEGEKELIPKWQHAPVCLFNRLVDVV